MDRKDQVDYCKKCIHNEFSYQKGIICGKGNVIEEIEDCCDDFISNGIYASEESAENTFESSYVEEYADIDDYVWVRKSEKEIKIEKEELASKPHRHKFLSALKVGTLVFVVGFLGRILILITVGVDPNGGRVAGVNRPVILRKLPEYYNHCLKFALVLALIAFVWRFIHLWQKKKEPLSSMCDSCNHVLHKEVSGLKCNCGGVYYPMSEYKWLLKKYANLNKDVD